MKHFLKNLLRKRKAKKEAKQFFDEQSKPVYSDFIDVQVPLVYSDRLVNIRPAPPKNETGTDCCSHALSELKKLRDELQAIK